MDRIKFGKTGLEVSVLALGSGGYSRLGMQTGGDSANAVRVVRTALDEGINIFDSAEWYETEKYIAEGVRGVPRDSIVLCTKAGPWHEDRLQTAEELRQCIQRRLRELKTDYLDVFQFHGIRPHQYAQVRDRLVPELLDLKQKGLIRAIGITEAFEGDTGHEMLSMAVQDPFWDVMMVGFNFLNQSARTRVFEPASRNDTAIMIMFAVRHALTQPSHLVPILEKLMQTGEISGESDPQEIIARALRESDSGTLAEIAYRFCRDEPKTHVVLTGTGSIEHLRANTRAMKLPPLSDACRDWLKEVFGTVVSQSGKATDSPW